VPDAPDAGFIIRNFHAHEQFPAISIIYFSTTTIYLGTKAVGIDYRGNFSRIDNPCKYGSAIIFLYALRLCIGDQYYVLEMVNSSIPCIGEEYYVLARNTMYW